MKHFNITVKGKVQGVYFRQSTLEKAVQLGLNGFVMNLPCGDVYIEVEGEADGLNEMVEWCRRGPPLALVVELIVQESAPKNLSVFNIL